MSVLAVVGTSINGKNSVLSYYPVFLDVKSRRCVIVGGGEVAWRKAQRLLQCGASVEVISRHLGRGLQELKLRGQVVHREEEYQASLIEGAFLVIGATDRSQVNERIARDAEEMGILSNVVDDPRGGTFILPSLLERGDLMVAVSTSGKSPALAKKIKEELALRLGPEYAVLTDVLGAVREEVIARGEKSEFNRGVFIDLVESPLLEQIRLGDARAAAGTMASITGLPVEDMELLVRRSVSRCGCQNDCLSQEAQNR